MAFPVALALLLADAAASAGKPPPAARAIAPKVLATLTLAATGDVMMHEAVKAAAAAEAVSDAKGVTANHAGFDALFAEIAPELRHVDLAFANLETPVAPKAGRGTRPFVFNAPPEVLLALKTAGFGVVSAANNHAFDQGPAGVAETVASLEAAGLPEVGAGRDRAEAERPAFFDVHGIRIAFLGFTARFNDNLDTDDPKAPRVAPADLKAMAAAVAAARNAADFVVVSLHWGTEYATAPDPGEADLAHALVDAGAGLLLGSHPHVLQPLELRAAPDGRLALVAYSLGNFISNQSRLWAPGVTPESQADTRDGVLLEVTLEKRRQPTGPPRVELGRISLVPLWTDNDAIERQRDPTLAPHIDVVPIDAALGRAQAALAAALAAKPEAPAEVERWRKRVSLLTEQRERIFERLGDALDEQRPAAH